MGSQSRRSVRLVNDADPIVLRALRRADIPVLCLDLDNYNQENADAQHIDRQITDFLEGPVSVNATRS
ncbi:MAG: 2-hydroxyacyl-CoA dehydratase family protein [Nevskiaceae bacterium]|jgi:hypothetical protein|nr:2-hydroxyacyl-CoA dehydratase family protein [Nevskiaceae bacterium]